MHALLTQFRGFCHIKTLLDLVFFNIYLQFPACGYDFSPERIEMQNDKDLVSALYEALQGENYDHSSRYFLITSLVCFTCFLDKHRYYIYD